MIGVVILFDFAENLCAVASVLSIERIHELFVCKRERRLNMNDSASGAAEGKLAEAVFLRKRGAAAFASSSPSQTEAEASTNKRTSITSVSHLRPHSCIEVPHIQ